MCIACCVGSWPLLGLLCLLRVTPTFVGVVLHFLRIIVVWLGMVSLLIAPNYLLQLPSASAICRMAGCVGSWMSPGLLCLLHVTHTGVQVQPAHAIESSRPRMPAMVIMCHNTSRQKTRLNGTSTAELARVHAGSSR